MNEENKIIGNRDEERQIPKLLRQAGQDKVIDVVVKGVEDTSLEERFSPKGIILGLEKIAEVDAKGVKDISLSSIEDNVKVAVADYNGVRLFDLLDDASNDYTLTLCDSITFGPAHAVAFTNNGEYIAAGYEYDKKNCFNIFSTSSSEHIKHSIEHPSEIDKIEFDSNADYLAIYYDGTAQARILRFRKHPDYCLDLLSDKVGLFDVSISPDGAYVVSAYHQSASVFEVPRGLPGQLKRIESVGFDDSVRHVAFSPEISARYMGPQHYLKDYYFAAATDRMIRIFKFLTPDKIEIIKGTNLVEIIKGTNLERPNDINSIALGHGNSLAVAYGHIASVYNLDEEKGLGFVLDIILPDTVLKAKFSPDGNWLATACKDDRVRLYKVKRK